MTTFSYEDGGVDQGWLRSVTQAVSASEDITMTVTARDAFGRPTAVTRATETLGLSYDVMGMTETITPPGRGAHTMDYSSRNELAGYQPPAYTDLVTGLPVATDSTWTPGADWFEAGSASEPTGTIMPNYHASTGRLTSIAVSGIGTGGGDGTIGLSYAPLLAGETGTGQLRRVTFPAGPGLPASTPDIATEWDHDGPLTIRERTSGGTLPATPWEVGVERDADDELRLRRMTLRLSGGVPTEVGRFEYDRDGIVTRIGAASETMIVASDRLTGALYSACVGDASATVSSGQEDCTGKVHTRVNRNAFGEANGVSTNWDGSSFSGRLDFGMEYDRAGRLTRIAETGATIEFRDYTYDDQGRLEDVLVDGLLRYHYTYDANGNRIGWNTPHGSCDPGAGTCTVIDEQDRLRMSGGVAYDYDDAGRLTQRTSGASVTAYDYDILGSVSLPSGTNIRYTVDAAGRRIGRSVDGAADRFWVYQDGLNPLAQLDATGALEMTFVYGLMPHVPSLVVVENGDGPGVDAVLRVITDQVGSVRRVVHVDTGEVWFSADYSPYGVIESESGRASFRTRFPFRFAGGLADPGHPLIRFGARDYDPELGRWTAKDPIRFGGGTTNLYQYASNSPNRKLDFNGLRTIVYVWDGGGGPQSWAGHVSVEVNGTSFSWEGNGLNIDRAINYLEDNLDTIDGHGRGAEFFEIALTEAEEIALVTYLFNAGQTHDWAMRDFGCSESQVFSSSQCYGYNLLNNNCAQTVMDGLSAVSHINSEMFWASPAHAARMLRREGGMVVETGRLEPGAIGRRAP